jgi:hypothetical protein
LESNVSRKQHHPQPRVEQAPLYKTSKFVPFVSFPGVTKAAQRKGVRLADDAQPGDTP